MTISNYKSIYNHPYLIIDWGRKLLMNGNSQVGSKVWNRWVGSIQYKSPDMGDSIRAKRALLASLYDRHTFIQSFGFCKVY